MRLLTALAGATFLTLAAASVPPVAAQTPSTLRIGLQEDPDVLDPHKARTFVGRIVFKGLCDKLLDITPDLKLVPRLATEWSFSADGLTLTMKLRADARFPDGEPFNAEAAKANLRPPGIALDRRQGWLDHRDIARAQGGKIGDRALLLLARREILRAGGQRPPRAQQRFVIGREPRHRRQPLAERVALGRKGRRTGLRRRQIALQGQLLGLQVLIDRVRPPPSDPDRAAIADRLLHLGDLSIDFGKRTCSRLEARRQFSPIDAQLQQLVFGVRFDLDIHLRRQLVDSRGERGILRLQLRDACLRAQEVIFQALQQRCCRGPLSVKVIDSIAAQELRQIIIGALQIVFEQLPLIAKGGVFGADQHLLAIIQIFVDQRIQNIGSQLRVMAGITGANHLAFRGR
ncbi:MAG TPA: hypothetical protein DCZ49_00960 [Hyphomonadaceae bacterium]|nr:hypothetical protein [Hyphomonadaceae bacterium]